MLAGMPRAEDHFGGRPVIEPPPTVVHRSASLSRDGLYRYRLGRRWGSGGAVVPWIMLNPSRADAAVDDPTIRRVVALSRSWGFDGCEVVNLFAFRTSSPRELALAADPTGPGNGRAMTAALDAAASAGVVVLAWGASAIPALPGAVACAMRTVAGRGLHPVAVGTNRGGSPRHPLYVPASARYSFLE